MISVENITKSFGKQTLFENVRFQINQRERIGLVGRNGHGKTTLFRIIIGEEHPDSGTVSIPRGYRIGYVRQHLDFTEDTVLKEAIKGLPENEQHDHWKVEKILSGLGFSPSDMHRAPDEFSGGFQVRLNLTKVLVSEPDLLLLDEPTNYLDITSIRWIENFLASWTHELILITHDRSFMDKIVTHVIGIHRRNVRKIPGNTEKYYAGIVQDEETYEKTRANDDRRRRDIEQFISRFRAKARLANMVQSRIKTLAKQEAKEKLETIKALDFSFRGWPFHAKYLSIIKDIGFSYDPEIPLIRDFSLSIAKGDRICVVGQNGKGKTTLLKLLAETLIPQNGEVTYNPGIKKGFFEQTNIASLVDSRTVEEEILCSCNNADRQLVRDICGAMMFEGDNALKKIGVISGGEKSRVMLGKLLITPANLLLLDEPTNHLDMESCDALLAALDCFEGAVVMVTHNEMFLHALARKLIVFQNDRAYVFDGSYQRFLEKGGWGDEDTLIQKSRKTVRVEKSTDRLTKKELRRIRSGIITERGKVLAPLEEKICNVENEIELNEKKLKECTAFMQSASQAQDGNLIAELSQTMHNCQTAIDRLFNELEELTGRFDQQKIMFEEKLKKLE